VRRPALAVFLLFAPLWLAPTVQTQAAAKRFRDCADCSRMTTIPAGRFRMGSPYDEPGRQDNEALPNYAQFVEATGYTPPSPRCDWRHPTFRGVAIEQTADEPVVCISWSDANAYVRWLSAKASHA
jgi:formylglycine-generating enzyme required for sulfatase activity